MKSDAFTVLHSAHYPQCTAEVDKRFDGYMSLQFSPTSGVRVSYDGERSVLHGAWFWPGYPGPLIRFGRVRPQPSWDHRYVAFHGALAQEWLVSGLFPRSPQPAPISRDYVAAFDQLLGLVALSDSWARAKAVNVLEGILIDLARERAQSAITDDWLQAAIRALASGETNYDALAARSGMALSTMRRHFREATGQPMHAFAVQCRIERARQMLGETDMPIKAIADTLGYGDVCYFSLQFRELAGATPAAYRRSRQR
jgi:AraC-like DNA-binding protein